MQKKKQLVENTKKMNDMTKKENKLLEEMKSLLKKEGLPENQRQEIEKNISKIEAYLKEDLKKVNTLVTEIKKDNKKKETPKVLIRGRGRGGIRGRGIRGRGRGRGRGMIGKEVFAAMSLDNRTSSFRLSDLPEGNLNVDLLKEHFSQYGVVDDVKLIGSDAIIKMNTRKEAEKALNKGTLINDHKASANWYMEPSEMKLEDGETYNEENDNYDNYDDDDEGNDIINDDEVDNGDMDVDDVM